MAAADFDNDGTVELLVNNGHDPPSLLKNYGKHGIWILVKLVGTKSNRDAIGARDGAGGRPSTVARGPQRGGYISQGDFRLHFGLGPATKIEVLEIRWPGGSVEKLENAPANQILSIKEGLEWSSTNGVSNSCFRHISSNLAMMAEKP